MPGARDSARMYAVITVSVRRPGGARPTPDGAPRLAEVLLIDHSSSMVNPPSRLAAARDAAAAALDRIPDGAHFAVVAGRDRAAMIYPPRFGLAVADARSRADARIALHACTPGGGTAMGTWLERARQLFRGLPDVPGNDPFVRHALLLTDGRNEPGYESRDELRERVEHCASEFTCDAVGIGDAWDTDELLLITRELGGRASAVGDLARLSGEFAALTARAAERDVTGLRLRLHHRADVTLHSFEQVHPTRVALRPAYVDMAAVESAAGGPIEEYATGAWGAETRDYLLCVSAPYRPDQLGKVLFLTEVEVDVAGPAGADVELPEPAAVLMRWSDEADLYSRLDPRVAHYLHEDELHRTFEQGCAALREGDTAAAEAHFARSWALATRTGDTAMQDHLRKLVDVRSRDERDPVVRLRTVIERFDIEAARIQAGTSVLPSVERDR
ncbi:VWA domain-containing protein [Streptomyces himalayensis]|uniref:VWA domain-containing protein n=1 Tax=Streptomyces himalayensis subsp. himalayensis TaxID=2756131 RepID=A0A7W0I969_9ACTN|nr:vWA domain-containing protein [Streptomyces himalayensis]MBA2947087.1 VWA domain-containing protein [Streptomyces himalayensis subsp. himalayensis]